MRGNATATSSGGSCEPPQWILAGAIFIQKQAKPPSRLFRARRGLEGAHARDQIVEDSYRRWLVSVHGHLGADVTPALAASARQPTTSVDMAAGVGPQRTSMSVAPPLPTSTAVDGTSGPNSSCPIALNVHSPGTRYIVKRPLGRVTALALNVPWPVVAFVPDPRFACQPPVTGGDRRTSRQHQPND